MSRLRFFFFYFVLSVAKLFQLTVVKKEIRNNLIVCSRILQICFMSEPLAFRFFFAALFACLAKKTNKQKNSTILSKNWK